MDGPCEQAGKSIEEMKAVVHVGANEGANEDEDDNGNIIIETVSAESESITGDERERERSPSLLCALTGLPSVAELFGYCV